MFRPFRAMLRDPETRLLAVAALVTVAIGTVGYMLLEHWTPVQAFYFSVVTLATVGYGDLHPTTEVSELFTVAYILAGLGILAAFVTQLAKDRGAEWRRRRGGADHVVPAVGRDPE
jgi:H+/Cl- antiporter ClcA